MLIALALWFVYAGAPEQRNTSTTVWRF